MTRGLGTDAPKRLAKRPLKKSDSNDYGRVARKPMVSVSHVNEAGRGVFAPAAQHGSGDRTKQGPAQVVDWSLKSLAIPAGLEPATRGVEIRYSIQLSYGTVKAALGRGLAGF